jgi:signal transduction histidine kinase/DNA-binding response OmpR family regulator
MWVIGRIGSVYSVDPGDREWRTYKGLNYQCETPEGLRWFTSTRYRSVVSQNLKTGEWLEYGPEEGVIDSTFNVIRSSQGLIWAAGSHQKRAAFSVYDGVNWTRFCHPELLRRFEPNAVLEAADGTVWMGVGGDIANSDLSCGGAVRYKINPDRSVELLSRHAPPDFPYYVTALAQTSDQVLWLGSTEVYRYDGLSPRAQPAAFLQGSRTIGMFVDSNQTVWVAKECFGVCRWRNDSWEVFGINEGLPSLNLRGMCLLQDGSIVVSSDKGISRFDGTIWKAEACPEWFRMIQRRSGIKQSGDGSFWFNYDDSEPQFAKISKETGGFCTVHHRPETDPPETWVAECLARVSPPGNSHIRWAGNDLWSVTPVKDLQYSWRLNGGGWSAFSHETGKTFLKLNSGRHILEVRARDRAFNIDPTPARVEFVVIPPVWRQPWFLTLVFVLVGLILSLTWLLIRSRERHLLERQADRENLLKRQQEDRERHLLEMDRLKTGFFTNISHELRTPMTVVCGRLETFLGSESDEQKKNALSVILRNAQRVTGLIAQLLDFRKIEEGKIAVEATKGDLVPSLRDWMASLQVLADQAQISLHLESVETCCGWFDFDKLQKIFTNLIANSIKYTMAGGEVRVYLNVEGDHCRAETVEDLSAARLEGQEPFQPCKKTSGRRLRFVVEDTGVGIAKEHQAHIFKPFYRVSEASMAQGAGIGLNLTRELVELLGGTIRVESPIHEDVNRPGSRFTVQLPMDLAQSRKDAKDGENGDLQSAGLCASAPLREESSELYTSNRSDSSNEESPLILVVEDDEEVRAFIVEGLESSCRVETAEDGLIGLQKAKEQVPDLIITDLMMPGMDGIALCKELKTSMETSHIPVIMLTAKASLEHQVEGLQTGADDYITKPFHMILLQTRIHNLLEARRVLREQFCREYPVLTSTTLESKVDKEFIDKALRVVEENYTDARFDLDEFAAALNISRRSLQRKLKAVADQTPLGFITEFRMMQAAKLLTGTENTIADICFQVGCDEPSNFYRLFKKYYQMSPSQYRAEKGGL